MCYNLVTEQDTKKERFALVTLMKGRKNMNAQINLKRNEIKELGLVSENCNCSIYSMITVAGGILLAIGTVVYSFIAL